MKNFLILSVIMLSFGYSSAQTFNRTLAGMYESTSGSDWVSLKENGTGKLYITSDFMNLGTFSFTWTSDEDQIFIHYKDESGYEDTKWSYWIKNNGVFYLDFPTGFGPNLTFVKTR